MVNLNLILLQYCKEPPATVANILRLRFVIAPPLLITIEVLLFIVGIILGGIGTHRILKPKYKLIQANDEDFIPKRKKSSDRGSHKVILNMSDNIGFNDDDDDLAKQAVSLLSITEEELDMTDLLLNDS